MSVILGVHDGHNAAAALLTNGRVAAAVQEERLTRQKNQSGVPVRAIRDVLGIAAISDSDATDVALDGRYMTYDHWDRNGLLAAYEDSGTVAQRLKQVLKSSFVDNVYQRYQARRRGQAFEAVGIDSARLLPVDHHTAHAAAAYYGSGWRDRVLVLTCDGSGDRLSATVSVGVDGRLERIAAVSEQDSIGKLYAFVTYYLGMLPLEHEYKVMGLAPYVGDPTKARAEAQVFRDLFEFDPHNPLVWRRRKGVPPMYGGYAFIRRLLYRRRFDLLAAGLQQFVEDMLTNWVRNCVRETGIERVACSGGVFMNVKANKEILALPEVQELFVFPSCGDETNSIGAAYWAHAQRRLADNLPIGIEPIGSIYWGRNVDDKDVELALEAFRGHHAFRFEYMDQIERLAAETIAQGEVVARMKGPMEFGARALGNRSILARADRPEVVRVINEMVKNRDFWMPFAPSVLAERATEYYQKPKAIAAPHMIIAFDSRAEARAKYLAAQHPYDYSVRPQEVSREHNSDYYALLKHYESITGEGIILNTSFNLHGHPIVYQPTEALEVFDRSGLRYLALGNFWVWKV